MKFIDRWIEDNTFFDSEMDHSFLFWAAMSRR
jgi:hypothetical protein